MNELSEQEQIRINKLEELRNLGINPYPSDEFIIDTKTIDILKKILYNILTRLREALRQSARAVPLQCEPEEQQPEAKLTGASPAK